MARIKLKYVTGSGGLQLPAPSYAMVPGTHAPIQAGVNDADGIAMGVPLGDPRLANITVDAIVPDEDVNVAGNALDPVKIKARYPEHPLVKSGIIK